MMVCVFLIRHVMILIPMTLIVHVPAQEVWQQADQTIEMQIVLTVEMAFCNDLMQLLYDERPHEEPMDMRSVIELMV